MSEVLDHAGEKAAAVEMENAGGVPGQTHRVEQKV